MRSWRALGLCRTCDGEVHQSRTTRQFIRAFLALSISSSTRCSSSPGGDGSVPETPDDGVGAALSTSSFSAAKRSKTSPAKNTRCLVMSYDHKIQI